MDLELTLRNMREKESDESFYPLVEMMKRKASKGMLEGVSIEAIDSVIKKIELEETKKYDNCNLNQELFELSEAAENFGYMDIESWSAEELEEAILYEFVNDIALMEESDYYDDYQLAQERKRKLKKGLLIGGASAAGTGAVIGTHLHGKKLIDAGTGPIKTKFLGKDRFLQGAHSIGGKIASGIGAAGKAVGGFIKANPVLAHVGIGAGLVGLGVGAYKLIKHLRRKRAENQLTEEVNITNNSLFSIEFKSVFNEYFLELLPEDRQYLKENGSEDTRELIEIFEGLSTTVLDEAVTYIDNAGNLQTKTAIDYNKDMHQYNTDTQISKYTKKLKRRDYNLISEEIDIDGIKKLSEMSLEDILNENI